MNDIDNKTQVIYKFGNMTLNQEATVLKDSGGNVALNTFSAIQIKKGCAEFVGERVYVGL